MTLDPLALAQAATATAAGRQVLEVAAELIQAAHQIAELLERLDDCVRFTATVERVELEPSSTRLVVHVRTRPDADPEALRTDRTDTAWATIVADRARRLVGHRVVIHKQLEQAGDDRKVRVLVWLDDTTGADADPAVTVARDIAATNRRPDVTPAGEVYARTTAAGIERAHVDALLRLRYEVDTAAQLDDQALRGLLAKLADPNGLERFRAAAAADHRQLTTAAPDQVPF